MSYCDDWVTNLAEVRAILQTVSQPQLRTGEGVLPTLPRPQIKLKILEKPKIWKEFVGKPL